MIEFYPNSIKYLFMTILLLLMISTATFPQDSDNGPVLPECYLLQGISEKSAVDIIELISSFHTRICADLEIDQKEFEQLCHIYIAFKDPPTGRANFEVSTLTSSTSFPKNGIKYKATLEILNPDLYNGKYINELGLPYDRHYYHKLLIHEISTCYIEYLLVIKDIGWGINDTPNWFRQGLEEYYGLYYSDDYWQTDGFRKYFEYHLSKQGGINFQFGIFPQNPYLDGAILFCFLHETYGIEKIRQIIISDQPDLGAAITHVLKMDLDQLATEFHQWRIKKANRLQLKLAD